MSVPWLNIAAALLCAHLTYTTRRNGHRRWEWLAWALLIANGAVIAAWLVRP